MIRHEQNRTSEEPTMNRRSAFLSAVALSALGLGCFGVSGAAFADDAPPASAPADQGGPHGRHHNPAWEACRKQADDQKLAQGDARHEFMKNCMKSSNAAPPAS
jgi:hypothetical protein